MQGNLPSHMLLLLAGTPQMVVVDDVDGCFGVHDHHDVVAFGHEGEGGLYGVEFCECGYGLNGE